MHACRCFTSMTSLRDCRRDDVLVHSKHSKRFNLFTLLNYFQENGCLYSHIRWGEAFVVVYSVTCKRSFQEARGLLKQLADLRLPSYFTALLLGNKRDLDHAREVCVDEGQQLSLAHGCQFYEVSAAESPAGAALAFQALLREARSVQLLRALPIRRKLGVHSVSRVLGTIFGKNTTKDRKKRPSLSI
ncbi:RERG inhibitor, partial [Acromyrmex insinuator]